MDNLPKKDHDILVTLVVKVDDLKTDIKNLSDGTALKIADHETRLKVIEIVHEKVQPEAAIALLNKLSQEAHDFKLTWKIVLGLVIGGSSLITFILTTFLKLTELFK